MSYGQALFSADGKGVFVTTDRESEYQRLAYINLADGKHTYLIADAKWDIDEWDLSPDGKRIAYALNEAGTSTLHMLEIASGGAAVTAKPVKDPTFDPPLKAPVITGLKWHHDPKQAALAFNVNSARSPSDVYTWSVAGGKSVDRALDRERDRRHSRRRNLSSRSWCAGSLSMAWRSLATSTSPTRKSSPVRAR